MTRRDVVCSLGARVLVALAAVATVAPVARGDVDLGVGNRAQVRGTLAPATEVESFRLRLPAGASLSVTAKGRKTKGEDGVPPVTFQLLDSEDTEVAAGLVVVKGVGAKLKKFPVRASGEYRIVVSGDGQTPGAYQLTVKWKSPRRIAEVVDLAPGDVTVPVSVDAGATVSLTVKASRGSSTLPRLSALDGDGFNRAFDLPDAGSKSHKAKQILLSDPGDYVLTLTDAGDGTTAKVTVKIKPPPSKRERVAITTAELGDTINASGGVPLARGDVIGATGGVIVLADDDVTRGIAGAGIVIPAGALPSAAPILVGSAAPILPEIVDPSDLPTPGAIEGRGPTIHFGPAGTSFASPVTITIPFDLASFGDDLTALLVVERDERGRTSVIPPDTYVFDLLAGTVSFPVLHFTSFRVFGPQRPAVVDFVTDGIFRGDFTSDGDQAGQSLDMDGDTLVFGAPYLGAQTVFRPEAGSGAVFVFVRDGDTWVRQASLFPDPTTDDGGFGLGVALDGERLAVTAFGLSMTREVAEVVVYHYERVGSTWELRGRVVVDEPEDSINIVAASVALEGDRLAVGVPGTRDREFEPGAVHVLERDSQAPGGFREVALLEPEPPEPPLPGEEPRQDFPIAFGFDLSLDGDTLAVGTVFGFSAYVFTTDGQTWTRQALLRASDFDPEDETTFSLFGVRVALEGDRLAVSSVGAFGLGGLTKDGAVYVFERTDTTWTETQRLDPSLESQAEEATGFGFSLDLRGDLIAVGASPSAFGDDGAGEVQVFLNRNSWTLEQVVRPPEGILSFGSSVIIQPGRLFVGATPLEAPGAVVEVIDQLD